MFGQGDYAGRPGEQSQKVQVMSGGADVYLTAALLSFSQDHAD